MIRSRAAYVCSETRSKAPTKRKDFDKCFFRKHMPLAIILHFISQFTNPYHFLYGSIYRIALSMDIGVSRIYHMLGKSIWPHLVQ